ncbi:MAG: hypothetical protein KI792_00475 [Alphaproteobacteria bacterium]|nr:hypothetical protein [Alphaproteobacteria bacterium SS10]
MVEATQRLMAKLAPDVLAAAEPPKHEVPTDEFVAAMAGYSHEEGFYHHRLLEQAVKAIGQPDTLTERNMPELLSRFEALSSDQIRDPDGMDYFWEDVTDKLNGTFKSLDEQRKAAAAAGPAADAAGPSPEVARRKL